MDLPNPIPALFEPLRTIASERDLFDILSRKTPDCVLFLEFATEDLTWSQEHPLFMTKALDWVTQRFYVQKFPPEFAAKIAGQLRKYFSVLEGFLPKDLTIRTSGHNYSFNSLLFTVDSEPLQLLVRRECREKNSHTLDLPGISSEGFEILSEYINCGQIPKLAERTESALYEVLALATLWELKLPGEWCQDLLKKYITADNKLALLKKCYEKGWSILLTHCMEWINQRGFGVHLDLPSPETFRFEFTNFRDPAMKIFEALREIITSLVARTDLIEHARFTEVLRNCPKLEALNISGTYAFSDRLLDIPPSLKELDLSSCDWITPKILEKIHALCPNLSSLSLAGNLSLDYNCWAILKEFSKLTKLDLSFCDQIGDSELSLILQACRGITVLHLNQCRNLSNQAFFELGKNAPNLLELDASRTHIGDSGLLDLLSHCESLRAVKVVRCSDLSEKGIKEYAFRSPSLNHLDITGCDVGKGVTEEISKKKPLLRLIT